MCVCVSLGDHLSFFDHYSFPIWSSKVATAAFVSKEFGAQIWDKVGGEFAKSWNLAEIVLNEKNDVPWRV